MPRVLLAGFFASASVALAELPLARLTSIFPFGAQAGESVEIALAGVDLDDLKELRFSRPGISAHFATNASGAVEANRFVVSVAPGTPPGLVDLRAWGRYGISNPRAFMISNGPELREAEPNNTRETAQSLPLGSWMNATTDPINRDWFKINVSAGSRLWVQAQTRELDSRASLVLLLLDATGAEKARMRRDGLLDFALPQSGEYFLVVHDHQFGGGAEFGYRLRAAQSPLVEYVWPPVAGVGTPPTRHLVGRNLPGGLPSNLKDSQESMLEVAPLVDSAWVDSGGSGVARNPAAIFANSSRPGTPPPPWETRDFTVWPAGGLPVHAEDALNPAPLPPFDAPALYAGFFHAHGAGHWVEFKAAKGDDLVVDVRSQVFGQRTDSMLVLQRISVDGEGRRQFHDVREVYDSRGNLHSPEFDTSSTDPFWRFQAPEESLYRVRVVDGFQTHRAHTSGYYILEIRRAKPSFALAALAPAPPNPNKEAKSLVVWNAFVRGGDRQPLKLLVDRRDGFDGAIHLEAEGLPPSLQIVPAIIPPGRGSETILIAPRPGETSGPWAGPVVVKGSAKILELDQTHRARTGVLVFGVDDYNNQPVFTRTADEVVVAYDPEEPSPVQIRFPAAEPIRTSLAAKVTIPLLFERTADWTAKIQFRTLTDPAKEFEWDGKGTNTSFELDLNQQKLPVGLNHIIVLGHTAGKMRRINPAEFADHQKRADEAAKSAAQAEEQLKTILAERDQTKARLDKGDLPPAEVEPLKVKLEGLAAQIQGLETVRDQGKALAKQLTDRGNLADVSATFYSDPIPIEVFPAPLLVKAPSELPVLRPGLAVPLAMGVERLFGFAGEVDVSVESSAGLKLAKPAALKLAAADAVAPLPLELAADQAAGSFPIRVVLQVTFNGQTLKLEHPLTLKVEAAPVLVTPAT